MENFLGAKLETYVGAKFALFGGLLVEASLAGRLGLHATSFEFGGVCYEHYVKDYNEKEIEIDIIASDIAFVSIKIVQ